MDKIFLSYLTRWVSKRKRRLSILSSSKAIFLSVLMIPLQTEFATADSILATIVAMDDSEMSDMIGNVRNVKNVECRNMSRFSVGGIRNVQLSRANAPLGYK